MKWEMVAMGDDADARVFVRNAETGQAIELQGRTVKQRKAAALIIAKMLNRFKGVAHERSA
jgi:hypothetical protein